MIKWRALLSLVATGVRLEEPLHLVPRQSVFLTPPSSTLKFVARSFSTRPIKQLHYRKSFKRSNVSLQESLVQQSIASRRLDLAKKQLGTVTTKIDRKHTWRPLILLARKGRHKQDLTWLEHMIEHKEMTRLYGLVPDLFDYHALMYCYGLHGNLDGAERIFHNLPCSPTVFSTNTLLGCYQRARAIRPALDLIHNKMTRVDIGSYNTVLAMLDQAQQYDQAKSLYQHIPMKPDRYTFSTMLHIATQTKDQELGQPIYDTLAKQLSDHPKELDITSINAMLAFLCTVIHDIDQAMEIYHKISQKEEWKPDTITCNIILDGLLRYDQNPGKAAAMVHQMTKRGHLVPDDTTFGIMMDAEIALDGDLNRCLDLFYQTSRSGRALSSLVTAAAKLEHQHPIDDSLWDILLASDTLDAKAYNGLMHALAKKGRADLCQTLYDRVFRSNTTHIADIATFTSLILAYINNDKIDDAMEIYHVLREQHYKQLDNKATRIKLDVIFYTTLISAMTSLDAALVLLKDMRQLRIQPSLHTYTTLLHWCGQAQDPVALDQIHHLIKVDMTLDPDIAIYNALMDGYNRTDQIDKVLYLWDNLVCSGEYDSATVSIVLDACGHHGQFRRGRAIWSHLLRSPHILNTNNYNSYIEFICRVGGPDPKTRWLDALDIARRMSTPNIKTLNTLASFARKYNLDQSLFDQLETFKSDRKRFLE